MLLIGGAGGAAADPPTAAWAAGLASQGVAFTEVDGAGGIPAETVTLPTLTSSTTHGLYNAVVFAGKPTDFAAGQLTNLFNYESAFGIRQLDGNFVPGFPAAGTLGLNSVTDAQTGAAISSTTATLTAAGLTTFAALNGPVPIDVGVFGSPGTVASPLPTGATETPLLNDAAGNVLIGVYQHPTSAQAPSDLQAGVAEMTVGFNYNQFQSQWLLLGPGLIDWVSSDAHLGMYRNYATIHVDDVFTSDNTWATTTHANDFTAALRMTPADVDAEAAWSHANSFRLDQLPNFGNSVVYQAENGGVDPLLAEFQKIDPATGKPYTQDFGWASHTWDHAYLDTACATQNYIEAEINQNTNALVAAPGATPGTGGLGLTSSTDPSQPYGTENPHVFIPGGHSGLADLVLGMHDAVDPPTINDAAANPTGGTLAAGSYQYALSDQFNGADSPDIDQSSASVSAPVAVAAGGSVTLQWQAECHAGNYLVYREIAGSNNWSLVGNLSTPNSATLPDASAGDPASTTDVTGGGMLNLTLTDIGAAGTAEPAGWLPPTTENAALLPWEQNPYFTPALEAAGITVVGADASKPYPNPADVQYGFGLTYAGTSYPAGTAFPDGTYQGVPRHPTNIYYNTSTEAQAVDEYNTVYVDVAHGGHCSNNATTTCLTAAATFQDIVNSVVGGMFTTMINNDPRPTYFHQTNIMGAPPAVIPATPPATSTAVGDGLLYSVLNPLLAKYHTYYNATLPYEQPTMGAISTILTDQNTWATTQPPGTASSANTISASQTGAAITITNNGATSVDVPITVPLGYEYNGAAFGIQYGGSRSGWQTLTAGQSIVISAIPPAITSAATANAQVGSPFTFTVTSSGSPVPALTETESPSALPAGLTFTPGTVGTGTATITGTPAAGTAGTHLITFTGTNIAGVGTQTFSLFVAQPAISITPLTNPPSFAVAGTPIIYNYKVTNTGNVPLITIGVTDNLPGQSAIKCPGTTLLVGANETCTANYTVSQADVDAGGITDPATAKGTGLVTGVPPLVVTGSASLLTPAIQKPAIAVAPSAMPGSFYGAPTAEAVSFLVTNSGNVTLHSIGVSDALAGLSGITCPSAPVAPAGTETCNATYTSTSTDVKNGGFNLSATATGNPPSGPAVNGSSSIVIPFWSVPKITSAKLTTVPRQTNVNFTFKATGTPTPLLTITGILPKGLTFTSGVGTATLTGTVNAAGTYPLTLTATSAAGTTTQAYTLRVTAPEFASGVAAQPGNGKATVKWTPPVLHGGLPAIGYVVTPYVGHTAMGSHIFHSTAKHQVIGGLKNGHTYTFKVAVMNMLGIGPDSLTRAQINALGTGPLTTASPAIKIGAPTAPAAVKVSPSTTIAGALDVRFSGAGGNGSPVTRYTAVCTSADGGHTQAAAATTGQAASIVVTGVTLHKTYTCSVTATNKRGTGPPAISKQVVA